MKSPFFKSVLLFLTVILLAIGFFFLLKPFTLMGGHTVNPLSPIETHQSIADIASNYKGALTRPLFPDHSLGLPLLLQAGISIVLIVLMLITAGLFPKARRFVMLLTVIAIARHLLWRGFDTLDLSSESSTIIGLVIYGAEILAFFYLITGYFQIYGQTDRKPVNITEFPPEQLPSVDVMVCTYNEPVTVLYRTLVGCLSLDYPNKQVYLLDDGNRPEMFQLAQKLGVHYISRTDNIHAKAGNLNNALVQTHGDLVLVFDADHVPCKSFLQHVTGFFTDNRLAFVQTPQHFFTTDPFQRNLLAESVINNEQDLFFHIIQPGNDYWDSAFFAGSGAIFRREALQQIGGFAVETITEDVHTGLRLHAKGWKSIYYNKDLSAGLAQDSFADFVKQRSRWARGMSQILFFDNPFFVRGLSLAQRFCYFTGISYFYVGLPRIIFLIAPLFFLLFGYKTINAGYVELLTYYIPSFLCLSLGYSIITKGFRQSFWSEVYETALCMYLLMTTTLTLFSPKRAKFQVTPKGTLTERLDFNWRVVFPQVLIASLLMVGIGMSIVRAAYTPEYAGGIYTNLFWAIYNLILLLGAIYVAQERPQYRLTPRIFKKVRCELRLLDGTVAFGYTTNISESGVAAVFDEPIPLSGTVGLKLMDWDINETTILSVQAIRSSIDANNRFYVGFRTVNRTDEQHQKLIRHMFGNAEVWENYHVMSRPGGSFVKLLLTPFRLSTQVEKAAKRRTMRFQSTLPCVLETPEGQIMGYSDEISESGLSLCVKKEQRLTAGQTVTVRIQWPNGRMSAITAQIKRMAEAGDNQWRLGLNFTHLTREQRLDIIQQIYRPAENLVRVAPAVQKVLPYSVTRQNDQHIQGLTLEISEMGVIISIPPNVTFAQDEHVQIAIQWSPDTALSYPGIVKFQDDYGPQYGHIAIIYFDKLDIKTLDSLSEWIHTASDNKAFSTPLGTSTIPQAG